MEAKPKALYFSSCLPRRARHSAFIEPLLLHPTTLFRIRNYSRLACIHLSGFESQQLCTHRSVVNDTSMVAAVVRCAMGHMGLADPPVVRCSTGGSTGAGPLL